MLKRYHQNSTLVRRLIQLALIAISWSVSVSANAHAPDQSYIFVRLYDDSLQGRVEMTVADLNAALELGLPEDGSVTTEALAVHLADIRNYFGRHVKLGADGPPEALSFDRFDIHTQPLGQYLQAYFELGGRSERPKEITAEMSVLLDERPSHRGMLVVEHNWQTGTFNDEANVVMVFSPDSRTQTYQVDGSKWQGFMAMIGQGSHHIWIGIDHILFLLALLLPAVVTRVNGRWAPVDRFRDAAWNVFKIVTVFTVAHSITLSAAVLGALTLSSRIVESIIALSIAIAAFDILKPLFGNKITWIVFGFGLFHGFGFASVLGDIGIGGEYLVQTLLGFNLGVEVGQLVIVAAAFPVLFLLRKTSLYLKWVLPLGAAALIAIAIYWFIERAFEVDLPAGQLAKPVLSLFS